MTPLLGLAQLLAVGFTLYFLAMVFYTIWALTHPPRLTYASAVHRGLPGDPSELETPLSYAEETISGIKGELPIWIIKGKNPQGPRVVMTHGWGSSRQGGLKRIEPFVDSASEVILWDLPGHGDAQGTARMGTSEHHDLARVLDGLIEGKERRTVLFGWSMGAGITIAFANEYADSYNISAVICEAPYIQAIVPARNVIRLRGMPYRLNLKPAMMILGVRLGVGPQWKNFARDQLVRDLSMPILLVHGQADPVCPIADTQAIEHSAQHAELVVINEGGHNNLWGDAVYRQEMIQAINAFLERSV